MYKKCVYCYDVTIPESRGLHILASKDTVEFNVAMHENLGLKYCLKETLWILVSFLKNMFKHT